MHETSRSLCLGASLRGAIWAVALLAASSACGAAAAVARVDGKVVSALNTMIVPLPTEREANWLIAGTDYHAAWSNREPADILRFAGWNQLRPTGSDRYEVRMSMPHPSPFNVVQQHSTLCWAAAVEIVLRATGVENVSQTAVCEAVKGRPCPVGDSLDDATDSLLVVNPKFFMATEREIVAALSRWGRGPQGRTYNIDAAMLIQDLADNQPFILGLMEGAGIAHVYVVTGMTFRPYRPYPAYTPLPLVLDTLHVYDPFIDEQTGRARGFDRLSADDFGLSTVKLLIRARP